MSVTYLEIESGKLISHKWLTLPNEFEYKMEIIYKKLLYTMDRS